MAQNSEEQPQVRGRAANAACDGLLQEQKGLWGWGKRQEEADLFSGALEDSPDQRWHLPDHIIRSTVCRNFPEI